MVENILFASAHYNVDLGDFGASYKFVDESGTRKTGTTNDQNGSTLIIVEERGCRCLSHDAMCSVLHEMLLFVNS